MPLSICKNRIELTTKYLRFWYARRELHPDWPLVPTYDDDTLQMQKAADALQDSELDYMRHLGYLEYLPTPKALCRTCRQPLKG